MTRTKISSQNDQNRISDPTSNLKPSNLRYDGGSAAWGGKFLSSFFLSLVANTRLYHWTNKWIVSRINRVGPKRLSQTVADLVHGRQQSAVWACLHARAIQSQEAILSNLFLPVVKTRLRLTDQFFSLQGMPPGFAVAPHDTVTRTAGEEVPAPSEPE